LVVRLALAAALALLLSGAVATLLLFLLLFLLGFPLFVPVRRFGLPGVLFRSFRRPPLLGLLFGSLGLRRGIGLLSLGLVELLRRLRLAVAALVRLEAALSALLVRTPNRPAFCASLFLSRLAPLPGRWIGVPSGIAGRLLLSG